jgi:uncharacterized membrane protein YhaH (DUF805 family)
MADTAPALSPQQAAQALTDIAGYEEGLSTRVGALTGMVWGIVSAAIFVSYGFAPQVSPDWLVPFLWLPWTLAGVAVTVSAWKLHAVSLGRPHDRKRSWVWGLGFTVLFATAIVLLNVLDLAQSAFTYMLVVNGLVAFVIVAAVSRRYGRLAASPMLVAGLAILAGAFFVGAADLSIVPMAFASAALVGASFVGASLVAFVRG